MNAEDIARFRDAVQLRDRCVRAAVEQGDRIGLPLSVVQARVAYDAMVTLIVEAKCGDSPPAGQ